MSNALKQIIQWIASKLKRVTSYTQSRPIKDVVRSQPLVTRTIRVDKERWEAYVKFCRERGTSTCFDIRSFMDARLGGEALISAKQPLTIHQTVLYETRRPRRKAVLPEDQQTTVIEYFGSPEKCAHCEAHPYVLGHLWVLPEKCHAVYLCRKHHHHYARKPRYSFRFIRDDKFYI